jgi:hypothetical protein
MNRRNSPETSTRMRVFHRRNALEWRIKVPVAFGSKNRSRVFQGGGREAERLDLDQRPHRIADKPCQMARMCPPLIAQTRAAFVASGAVGTSS